jgi:hypothetical protein
MDVSGFNHSDSITVNRSPGQVYAIGEYRWDTHCKVVAATPGREFSFVNHGPNGDVELVRWGYTLEPQGDDTVVTESWRAEHHEVPIGQRFVRGGYLPVAGNVVEGRR